MTQHAQLLITAHDQTQAELICSLLSEQGIPSLKHSSSGLSLPGVFDIGAVDILVAEQDLQRSLDLIEQHTPERHPS